LKAIEDMSGTIHGKDVLFPNPMAIVTRRLIAELICAHKSEMQSIVMSGGVNIVPVTLCSYTFPADP